MSYQRMNNPSIKIQSALIILAAIVILWPILFKNTTLLDATPNEKLSLDKSLTLNQFSISSPYTYINSVFDKISFLTFSLVIILGAFVSYWFIRKLTKHNTLSAVFFIFNPFVYSRIMSGQVGVLCAYFLVPATIYYTLSAIDKNSYIHILIAALIASISAAFQQQFFVINSGIVLIVTMFNGKNKPKSHLIFLVTTFLAILILLSSYWLQGFVSSSSITNEITPEHASFFAPKLSAGVGTAAKIIGMWGFWREAGYITTYNTLPLVLWYGITFLLFGLMLIGYYTAKDRQHAKTFYTLWWIGFILALGISHPWTAPIFNALFNYLPFFNGFRDSHKFVALIALAYAFLIPIGLMWVADKFKALFKKNKAKTTAYYAVPVAFIGLFILYTYPLIGLWGQVHPTEYPQAYEQTNEYLKAQNISGNIVYLPHYDYLTYNWTLKANPDGRIANPINKVVEPIVITNPGPWGAQTNQSITIEGCVNSSNISCLEQQDVQYVLVDKCYVYYDQLNFSWLENPVNTTACVDVYKLNNAHVIDRTIHVPLRFIIGSIISAVTLITLLLYLWKPEWFQKAVKPKRKH